MLDIYINLITETRKLLKDILDDENHGVLTFEGLNGLEDLTVKCPKDLEILMPGTVVAVNRIEWMRATGDKWIPCSKARERLLSDDMYIKCLAASRLHLCHKGL